MIHLNIQVSSIAIPLYIIAFIGFIENINNDSKIKIEYFEKHNINYNYVKIIILSILSIILLCNIMQVAKACILTLTYLTISTVKLAQTNKKKQILILWGIPIILTMLLVILNAGNFRIKRITASFIPEIDPTGSGWQGMEQKSIINSSNLFGKADYESNASDLFNVEPCFTFISFLANYGWIMSIAMVIMIIAFNIKLILDARKIKNTYGKLLIIGLACTFILRSTLCILMNLNLSIKMHGVDIPFISYGKLNLAMDILTLALMFSVYRRKDVILGANMEIE